jgi:hypothetical protein
MEATVRWYVAQGLVVRPLPRIAAEAQEPHEAPEGSAGPGPPGSLFEPPSGREREPSP